MTCSPKRVMRGTNRFFSTIKALQHGKAMALSTRTVDFQPFGSPEQLASAAAQDCLNQFHNVSPSEIFSVALAGGRIARIFFSALTEQVKAQRISLGRVHFFWSDERCVPPTDVESNFH